MEVFYNDKKEFNLENKETRIVEFYIIRIEDLKKESEKIIVKMKNMTWLNNIESGLIREAYMSRALKTSLSFEEKVNSELCDDLDELLGVIGEKAVTINSTELIEQEKQYPSVVLPELWKMKKDGNPGFDYFNENKIEYYIVFGEGKFKQNQRPYNDALKQVDRFIRQQHDLEELPELERFVDEKSVANFENRVFSIGFSMPKNSNMNYAVLFNHILKNNYLHEIIKKYNLIVVGVEL